jgi:hypothetical protein
LILDSDESHLCETSHSHNDIESASPDHIIDLNVLMFSFVQRVTKEAFGLPPGENDTVGPKQGKELW